MKTTLRRLHVCLRFGIAAFLLLIPALLFLFSLLFEEPLLEVFAVYRKEWLREIVSWAQEPLHDFPLLTTLDIR